MPKKMLGPVLLIALILPLATTAQASPAYASAKTNIKLSILPTREGIGSRADRLLLIPALKRYFDLDNSGTIEKEELFSAISRWVEAWRSVWQSEAESKENSEDVLGICDLDGDGDCTLIDFSVLLYYVER